MIHAFEMTGNRKMVGTAWLIDRPIGSGAFGTVYTAYKNRRSSREYAVKVIPSTKEGISSLVEAVVMTCLHHPHLNSAIDILVEPERICIFQERAIGTLSDYIDTATNDTKKMWTYQLVSAIKYLATLNLIHGDIKAGNILLYSDGNIKLADFGLVTKIDAMSKRKLYTRTHRPPEVWRDNTIKLSSDVWALGATLFEIYTGTTIIPSTVESYESALPYLETITTRIGHLDPQIQEVLRMALAPVESRVNIHDLVKLEYFRELRYEPGHIKSLSLETKMKDYTKLMRDVPENYQDTINYIANSLNKFKTRLVPKFTDEHRLGIATLLTYKLNHQPIPSKFKTTSLWFKLEREACSYLGFVLWCY